MEQRTASSSGFIIDEERQLHPTVEITKGISRRVTGWGWKCSCGDELEPEITKRAVVLEKAREHFDTKHGGEH